MSLDRIKNTSLWKTSLCESIDDQYNGQREEIRSSLLKFRENTSHLVSQISKALPGLTQHELSHLDALWETASIICGDDYPLNPLEAFVLGGAILLHDSALCFEAYKGGISGVRDTVTWRDHYAQLTDHHKNESDISHINEMADFSTLRSLHAKQAESLANYNWKVKDEDQGVYLIENITLRNHLGKLIGQIAGSHHWSIDEILSKLPNQINSLSTYPREWRIDPVKLACILRCADASQIDNERAPDFLHALIKRRGISLTHWIAQNKLANADIDTSDLSGSTLLFTSTSGFAEEESEAWWVAYDATCMIDKEIRASNALMESRKTPCPQFIVKRVKGVETPELMSNYIQTEGWHPCVAEIHVGNIEGLINTLGGDKLYGTGSDKLEVILRELIQNSRDSVHARRECDSNYTGKITVRIKTIDEQKWICIEDDGVGMSKRVLTGPLLDFGTSFWTSSLVQSEFPGLRSSKFKSVGKFGIGFYSVFMCSDEVRVASRPWKNGTQDVWQVHFKNGLSLRPMLKKSVPLDFPSNISTQVSICLNKTENNLTLREIKRGRVGAENIKVDMPTYISAICAGLDVSIILSEEGKKEQEVHHEKIDQGNSTEWLKRISFSDYQDPKISSYIESNAHRLRPVIENNQLHGIAALSTCVGNGANFLSLTTVGGLATSIHGRGGDSFIGYLDYLPQSARRDGQLYSASEEAMAEWAEKQNSLIDYSSLSEMEKYSVASNLCNFGVDPFDVAMILVAYDKERFFVNFSQLAKLAFKQPIAILKSTLFDGFETHHNQDFIDGCILITPISNGKFFSLKMQDEEPKDNRSILGCLCRAIQNNGCIPIIEENETTIRSIMGPIKMLTIKSESL
ncbi:HD domain-containing protein [Leucothrix arctica]|uniref:ATP-binding protein n=1 Tax=Leucothrix arctica TaxID=1481894 RepID=A0A317CAI8_9GAMM|nr:ATP-binding protein [Leucothrix arctica]PWQ95558.1 ATP-binding protein [Leucothrix arctica]